MVSTTLSQTGWRPAGAGQIDYPSHGDPPLTDTDVQRLEREAISQFLLYYFRDQPNVYVSADLFVYFKEGRPDLKIAPDVFICFGVAKASRHVYKTWEENHGVDWALEIVSKGTWKQDLFEKRRRYIQDLRTKEYFVFDPEGRYLPEPLMGFELKDGDLMPVEATDSGRIRSKLLALDLGLEPTVNPISKWELHFYQPEGSRIFRREEARKAAEEARKAAEEARKAAEERAASETAKCLQLEEALRLAQEEISRLKSKSGQL